jgi:septum formation protein
MLTHPPLYLASKSPRRQELLRAANIAFEFIDVDVKEDYPDDMFIEEIPEYLARKKAEAALLKVNADHLVLAADSVVIHENTVFGKPVDAAEAEKMLQMLAGNRHLVITGVFLGSKQRGMSFSDFTSVWIEPMTQEEIQYYIKANSPYDKAGSYGIQDWIGWSKVSRIEGSFANVMGLPVHRVYDALRKWNDEK